MAWVLERRMWHPSRDLRVRVETLDQHHFVRPLGILEEPPMPLVGLHRPRLTLVVGVDGARRNEVFLGNGPSVRDTEGVFVDCLDGAPGLDM